ncbi:MAG: C40 family peptidase [Kurthia sp.]|nr:C40 family peptidase [Candidatus Kurthia equi]
MVDVEASIVETEKRMKQRETLLNERMTAYQEQESVVSPYLEVILGADSFSDLLSRAISVKTIIDADKDLLNQQEQDKTDLEDQQQKLLDKKNDLQQQFQEMQEQEKNLEVKQLENKAKSLKLKEQIATKKQQEKLEKERIAKEKEAARLKALAEKEFLQQQAIEQQEQAEAKQAQQQAEAQAQQQQQQQEVEVIETQQDEAIEADTDTPAVVGQSGSAGNGSNGGKVTDKNQQAPTVDGDTQAKAVIAEASKYLGTSYVWGGSTPSSGFDCSGLTQWSFKKAGVSIPRTAAQQYLAADKIDASEAKSGDLVFFSYGKGVAHVGIYLGDGRMLDSQNNGVVIESLDWWNKYLVGYGRF